MGKFLIKIDSNMQNNSTDLNAAVKNNPCGICRAAGRPICTGHGGGGGGGSDDSEDSVNKAIQASIDIFSQLTDTPNQTMDTSAGATNHKDQKEPLLLTEKTNDSNTILNLLLLTYDKDTCTLVLKLQCNPAALSADERKELEKLLAIILEELHAFQAKHGISVNCATIKRDSEEHFLSLRIVLPTPALCEDFIQHMARKNIHYLNPFSTRPTPKATTVKKETFSCAFPRLL